MGGAGEEAARPGAAAGSDQGHLTATATPGDGSAPPALHLHLHLHLPAAVAAPLPPRPGVMMAEPELAFQSTLLHMQVVGECFASGF